jgi:hypothetical protein
MVCAPAWHNSCLEPLLPVLQVYRHIVLAVHDPSSGLYGALGISRRGNLMYKPLVFSSLAALLADYQEAYRHAAAGTLIMQLCRAHSSHDAER